MAKTRVTLKVEGMSCEHCVKSVTNALKELKGVKKAKVSLKNGRAEVTYNSDQIEVDALVEAVKEAGYEATV